MRALVVYESMFGNTAKIAEAVADGLSTGAEVTLLHVADAPADVPPDVDVVVVGGPTHTFTMSREATREEAARRGGDRTPGGIREWLQDLPTGGHPQDFAAFDTRVNMPLLPGAASHSATRLARKRGFSVTPPECFLVYGYHGPLISGEVERAQQWGRHLSQLLAD
ncbi:MAG TPA: flavodoxin domain-containing protein [Ruania sp.]|nr:flavodoxin domain-containing protein [Ruania sp.]